MPSAENDSSSEVKTGDKSESPTFHSILTLGIPGKEINSYIREISEVTETKHGFHTSHSGEVRVVSPLAGTLSKLSGCDAGASGEGLLYCLIIALIGLAIFAVVWVVVMLVFSIVTLGGFIKRRHCMHLLVEKENPTFLGKMAIRIARRGGVMYRKLGNPSYDEWMEHAHSLYERLSSVRRLGLLFGFIWGCVEVYFKAQNIMNPDFHYNLWTFRFFMIAIFLPLLFYSPILEYKIRQTVETGLEVTERAILIHPELNPNEPMRDDYQTLFETSESSPFDDRSSTLDF